MSKQPPSPALRRILTALATLAGLTFGLTPLAAGPHADDQPEPAVAEMVRFEEQTRSRVFEFAVADEIDAVRLTIRARVKEGEVTWILEDPKGERRLSGHGIRGRIAGDTGELASPTAGTWTLTLSTERATGWTQFQWFVER